MSNSSPSSLQQELTPKSDAVFEVSLSFNKETPNPPPKSIPPPSSGNPEEEEEEEEGGGETEQQTPAISSGMSLNINPPITDLHLSLSDSALTSPSGDTSTRRRPGKRKKGKGKGKNYGRKKQKEIDENTETLKSNLVPIAFIPTRILDFTKHEKLLKKLSLWEFVHIDFDRSIRVDLIAELVASYNPRLRASYVNDYRFMVNRADLARAFKLPLKKEKGHVEVDLGVEALSEESIGFMVDFVSEWVLLHEDTWMMPNEVSGWLKLIKDGHPEKVDWAGLLWLMVEKELKQGVQLKECYYASHMQHLLKHQRPWVTLTELSLVLGLDGEEANEEEEDDEEEENNSNVENVSIDTLKEEDPVLGGPSTKLTLGQDDEKEDEQDGEKEDGKKDVEMVNFDKCKDSDEEGGKEEEDRGHWLSNGKNDLGEHILQRCGVENNEEFSSKEEDREEELDGQEDDRVEELELDGQEDDKEEELELDGQEDDREEELDGQEDDREEEMEEFHVYTNDGALEGDEFTGNLLEGNHMGFSSQDQLHDPSSMDVQHISSAPSFFNNSGKRVLEQDNDDSSNKRLRINNSWDNKQLDLGMCMDQIAQMAERAKVLYAEREHTAVESSINNQILLNELQKRDSAIEHLHKTRLEEAHKKDSEIFRLERELYLMGNVLEGYRKALKDVQKSFAEYRERANLAEESTYKDTGEGGLMLTALELEKLRKNREEEYKMKCLVLEQNMKEMEEDLDDKFSMYVEKVNLLDKKLTSLQADAKEMISLYAKRKNPPTEENITQVSEPLPNPKSEGNMAEVSEPLPNPDSEEKVAEVSEPLPNPELEEKVLESPQIPEPEATAPGPDTDEKGPEVAEPQPNE